MLSKFALTFALASVALGGSALAQEPGAAKTGPTVTVVGVATEDVRPDIAIVTFDILDERPTASDAAARTRGARPQSSRASRAPESRRRTSRRSASA